MPPCLDVYAWVPEIGPDTWAAFIREYVSETQDREPRWPAFRRVFILGSGTADDDAAVDELRAGRDDGAVTIYLQGRACWGAMVTMTGDGAVVLGVSLDDPNNDRPLEDAEEVLTDLMRLVGGSDGLFGAELPPPSDRDEWERDDPMVMGRATSPGR